MSKVLLPELMRLQAAARGSEGPSAVELRRMLVEWNSTEAPYPRGVGVHGLVEKQAQRFPERVAVAAGDVWVSYAELNARANGLANYLRSIGVGAGVAVGVCVDRSVEMVIGLLGILKAGGAYVPLDPAYPRERLRYLVEDSGAAVIVTLSSLVGHVPKLGGKVVCLDTGAGTIDRCGDADPLVAVGEADLAYVIYTSGSTGEPKGVEVTHGGVVNYVTSINRILGIDERDVFMAVTTLSFDICGFDLFSPLSAGGKILLIDRETCVDGLRLRQELERSDATVLQATPSAWRLLVDAGWRETSVANGADARERLPVRRVFKAISGGDTLPRELADAMLSRGVDVWNLYGPTETTIYSAFHHVGPGKGPVPIGRPLDNTTLYILDSDLQPVRIGEVGELFIGGVGVARGYRNRAEMTAERFLPDPYRQASGGNLYRTGDLARYRADGVMEFLGRVDHQVKIRGFRIELQEIEAHLLKQPGVSSAVVVSQEGAVGAQRLVAFVAGKATEQLSAAALRQGLREALPEYMIPAQYVILAALPLTLNGKIDRRALPQPAWGQSLESEYVTPADEVERDLAEIFAKVLNAPRVGGNYNFFDLGGDSLSAVSVAMRVRERFNRTITLAGLYQAATPAELAVALRSERQSLTPTLMEFRRTGSKTPLFCLPGVGGSSLGFRKLVRLMPEDRAVYGYNILPVDQRPTPLNTIRDYALDVLKQIREVCPSGPFHLLGYSLGGSVAFEIAHVLAERGEPVGFIGMIDTWAPGFPVRPTRLRRMTLHLKKLISVKPRDQTGYVLKRLRNLGERVSRDLRRVLYPPASRLPVATMETALFNLVEVGEIALDQYVPKVLKGKVNLFRVEIHPEEWIGCSFEDPYNGWRPFASGEIVLTRLHCDHGAVFEEPEIGKLALAVHGQMVEAEGELSPVSGASHL
jgi:amino acid adenylation domain-containing protein